MNFNRFSYTIILSVSLGLGSCNVDDFFEIERPQETQWVNTITFDQGLSSAYYFLTYASGYRGTPQMLDYTASGVAQLLPETSTGAAWNQMYNRLFGENFSHTNDIWRDSYIAITVCNTALNLDEDNNGNPFRLDPNGTDYKDNYTRQIGEYHFLRAFAYYNLAKTFMPPYDHNGSNNTPYIPFKTRVPVTKEEIINEKLGTPEEIYGQIMADLQTAKAKLPAAYNSNTMIPTYQSGRANRYAAAALLSKVAFIMGDYTMAIQEADFVINAAENENRYALEEPEEVFNKVLPNDIPRETIWEFNSGDPTITGASMYMYWGWVVSLQDRDADDFGRGSGMSKSPTNQFTLSYWALDKANWMTDPLNGDYTLTDEAREDLRFQQIHFYLLGYKQGGDPLIYETVSTHTKVNKPQIYIDKYFRGGPGDGRYSKFPLIRLADLYLIRSWMNWKTGNAEKAASDLNKVWNRANPAKPDRYTAQTVNHETILSEYIKEMSGEGWTLDFMIGTQMDIPAADNPGLTAIAPPYNQWKWQIPAVEISLNPNYK